MTCRGRRLRAFGKLHQLIEAEITLAYKGVLQRDPFPCRQVFGFLEACCVNPSALQKFQRQSKLVHEFRPS